MRVQLDLEYRLSHDYLFNAFLSRYAAFCKALLHFLEFSIMNDLTCFDTIGKER